VTPTSLAKDAVAAALAAGATDADASLAEHWGVEVRVRAGDVEHVEEARSRGLGVRAFRGKKMGLSYTNDVSADGVRRAGRLAAELASVAAEDPAAGLPDAADLGAFDGALDVVDRDARDVGVDRLTSAACRAESSATSRHGVSMSEGARAAGGGYRTDFASSRGFSAQKEKTYAAVSVSVVASGADGERQRGAWGESAPHWSDVGRPEAVGEEAARRALERVGWKKPPTGPCRVVFSPEIARDFAQTLASAASASAVYRRTTFLADRLGETIASPALTLVDDPTLPRRAGSRPFDGEGVRSRRTPLVDRGRLASWLAHAYSARRTSTKSTGNASRMANGGTSVAPSNLVLAPGTRAPAALLADVGEGLYVTELFGFGVNLTSGQWSRGGCGSWIQNGKLAHPVQELTIAGELPAMLAGFREAANDLQWHGSCAAPTVWIDGLVVAAG